MTTGFDLFGIPETPTLPIRFTQFLNVFEPVGLSGVPDPQTAPMSLFNYMMNKANVRKRSAQQRPMVRLADKDLNIMAELVGEISCDTEELMSDTGQARMIITYDNWLIDWIVNQTRVDEDIHLVIDPIPTQRSWRTRWGGKVHQINVKRNEDGTSTCELIALSMREHAKKLLVAANPVFPPEVPAPAGAPQGALAGAGTSGLPNFKNRACGCYPGPSAPSASSRSSSTSRACLCRGSRRSRTFSTQPHGSTRST